MTVALFQLIYGALQSSMDMERRHGPGWLHDGGDDDDDYDCDGS